METKNIPGRETQAVTPFGTSPIPLPPSLKQTNYDGVLLKDRYLIEGELGRGGIGVVYLARDTQLMNRRVVIKVLLEDSGNSLHNPWFKKKFEQEIEALVRLDHPGIVGVLDAGTMPDGKEFFVMQFVEGRTLRSLVDGEMSFAQVARIIRQVGHALSAAHDKGIVHRDLKPENIMVQQVGEDEEQIKLIDFGIASVKDSQVATNAEKTKVAGALPYMAPEQLRGQPDASSDIWALGAMAYEMLTGRLPFYADTLVQLYELQKRGVQASPRSLRHDLPPAADAVLLKSMAFDPADRYPRARDLAEELARALTGEQKAGTSDHAIAQASSPAQPTALSSPATSESPGYGTVMTHSARTEVGRGIGARQIKQPPASQRSKLLIAVACLAVAVAGAVGLWTSLQSKPSQVAAPARLLNYSLLVLPNPARNAGKQPLAFAGEIIFTPGDQLCFNVSSPQDGYLYIISEGPEKKNGLPAYNLLFPDPTQSSAAAPSLKVNQQLFIPSEKPPWFPVDEEKGTETLWLVWSDRSVAEMEIVKKWLNEKDGGEIKDAGEIRNVEQFLNQHYPSARPVAEKDEQQTHLKGGKDSVLVYPVKLAHT